MYLKNFLHLWNSRKLLIFYTLPWNCLFNVIFLWKTDHDFAVPGGGQKADEKMTNADFRKMMMTPRTSGPATLGPLGGGSATPTSTPKDEKGM